MKPLIEIYYDPPEGCEDLVPVRELREELQKALRDVEWLIRSASRREMLKEEQDASID